MTTPRKTAPRKTAPKTPAPEPIDPSTLDTWSRLKYEAAQRREQDNYTPREFEPYVIDSVSPPIVIEAPTTAVQQMVIAKLIDENGDAALADIYDLLEAIVGDAFPRLVALLKRDRADEYMIGALVNDIRTHFNAQAGTGSNTVPGKSRT